MRHSRFVVVSEEEHWTIVLTVADNHFVHKGDELFEIDPADYRIALEQAQAQAQRDDAALDYARADQRRKAILAKEGWTPTEIYQQTTSKLRQSEAVVALDKAAIAKAQLDLSRTVIHSPVNGYVTNLRAQLGDYATVGEKIISVVDADSFWIDGPARGGRTSRVRDVRLAERLEIARPRKQV
jgi:multidrug resistance efflux pump